MTKQQDANAEMQKKQYEIDNDMPFSLKLGKHTYKVPYLKDWVGNRISYEIAKKNEVLAEDNDPKAVIHSMKVTGDLPAKVISLAILGSWIKIKLFHWFFWRYITVTTTKSEQKLALEQIVDSLELSVFFYNIISIENMNQLKMKLTKVEASQYRAELLSGSRQTS
ncbi:MAG: hypothetical protein ACLVKO_06950 [Dysgonomonas sp.]